MTVINSSDIHKNLMRLASPEAAQEESNAANVARSNKFGVIAHLMC